MKNHYKLLVGFGIIGLIVVAKAIQDKPPPPPPNDEQSKGSRKTPTAPVEFTAEEKHWFNTEEGKPLRIADLKGKKIIAIQFWRFGCPHCAQSTPKVVALYNAFKDKGLVLIGVHTPGIGDLEEQDPKMVEAKVKEWGINYPVVLDAHQRLWNAYACQVYPSFFLVDKTGKIYKKVEPQDPKDTVDVVREVVVEMFEGPKKPPPKAVQKKEQPATLTP